MKDMLVTTIALCGGGAVLYAMYQAGGWGAVAGVVGVSLLIYSWQLSLSNKDDDG